MIIGVYVGGIGVHPAANVPQCLQVHQPDQRTSCQKIAETTVAQCCLDLWHGAVRSKVLHCISLESSLFQMLPPKACSSVGTKDVVKCSEDCSADLHLYSMSVAFRRQKGQTH